MSYVLKKRGIVCTQYNLISIRLRLEIEYLYFARISDLLGVA